MRWTILLTAALIAMPARAAPEPAGLPAAPTWKVSDGIDPAAAAAATRLLDAMDARAQLHASAEARLAESRAKIIAQMGERVPELRKLRQSDPAAYEQRKEQIGAQLAQAGTEMLRAMEPELMQELVGLYVRRFTAAELDALAAFFRSPLGVKYRQEMPGITKASVAASQRIMLKHLPKILEQMTGSLASPAPAPAR